MTNVAETRQAVTPPPAAKPQDPVRCHIITAIVLGVLASIFAGTGGAFIGIWGNQAMQTFIPGVVLCATAAAILIYALTAACRACGLKDEQEAKIVIHETDRIPTSIPPSQPPSESTTTLPTVPSQQPSPSNNQSVQAESTTLTSPPLTPNRNQLVSEAKRYFAAKKVTDMPAILKQLRNEQGQQWPLVLKEIVKALMKEDPAKAKEKIASFASSLTAQDMPCIVEELLNHLSTEDTPWAPNWGKNYEVLFQKLDKLKAKFIQAFYAKAQNELFDRAKDSFDGLFVLIFATDENAAKMRIPELKEATRRRIAKATEGANATTAKQEIKQILLKGLNKSLS